MSALLLPRGKFGAVLCHAGGNQFVKSQTDVPDRVHRLLSPGEGYGLLFEILGPEVAVRLMDDGIPTIYGVTHGLCQVLPFLVKMSG
jgi:hypothetical protein